MNRGTTTTVNSETRGVFFVFFAFFVVQIGGPDVPA